MATFAFKTMLFEFHNRVLENFKLSMLYKAAE